MGSMFYAVTVQAFVLLLISVFMVWLSSKLTT